MQLIDAIETHLGDDPVNPIDWDLVAEALNSATVKKTSAGTLTSMAQTLGVLDVSEIEPTLKAFGLSELGKSGLQKLASTGLDFAHPLTVGLIKSMRADLPVGVADKLLLLGEWSVSPAAEAGLGVVTADQCRAAFKESVRSTENKKRQSALAEANDICVHLIAETDAVTQQQVVDAFIARLAQEWPE